MRFKKYYPFLLVIFLHVVLLAQTKYTVWPEMILYPYLMLNDFFLYKDIVNPYFPLLSVVLFSFFKLFGLSILNLKILTWGIILLTDLAVYYGATKFYKSQKERLTVLIIFILLQLYHGGNSLWFELFLSPIILVCLILIYFYPSNFKRIFISGMLFGLAVLIKQNVILFLIPIGLFFLYSRFYKSFLVFILAFILVLGFTGSLIYYFGVWNEFVSWAIKLPLSLSKQNGFVQLPAIRQLPLILFPLISLIPFLLNKEITIISKVFWLLSFLIALQFAFPRYENFHLQVLVALSSLFVPMLKRKYLFGFLTLVVVLSALNLIKNFHQPDRFIDQSTLQLSEKIKKYPSVYILNGPELSYYFAQKLPPKPWATNFPWYFEFNNFEKQFIDLLKLQKIEYVVIGDRIGGKKYALGNYLPAGLEEYIKYNYVEIKKFQSYTIWQRKSQSQ